MTDERDRGAIDMFWKEHYSTARSFDLFNPERKRDNKTQDFNVILAKQLISLSTQVVKFSNWTDLPNLVNRSLHDEQLAIIKKAGKPIYILAVIWGIFKYGEIQLINTSSDNTQLIFWGIGFTGITHEKFDRFLWLLILFYSSRLWWFHIKQKMLCGGFIIPGRHRAIRSMASKTRNLIQKFYNELSYWKQFQNILRGLAFLNRKTINKHALNDGLGTDLQPELIQSLNDTKSIYLRFTFVDIMESFGSVIIPFCITMITTPIAFIHTISWVLV